jgi:hypothetical protein
MSYWEYKETMSNHDSKKSGGSGCAVMMLPFVMIFGFVRERKEKKTETDQSSQEDAEKGIERALWKVRAEHA